MFEMSVEKFDVVLLKCRLLKILATGCTKHPAYKAKQRPRTECLVCKKMYESRQKLKEID